MTTNATIDQLNEALRHVNTLYDGNISFNNLEKISANRIQFTLRVKDSKGPGHRRSFQGRRLPHACWHVHGYFFEYLFLSFDGIFVRSQIKNMRSNADNWTDQQIGSMFRPLRMSQACDCNI